MMLEWFQGPFDWASMMQKNGLYDLTDGCTLDCTVNYDNLITIGQVSVISVYVKLNYVNNNRVNFQ